VSLLFSAPPDSYEGSKVHPVMQLRMKDIGANGNGRVMTCQTGNGRELFINFAIALSKYRNKPSVYDYLFLLFNDAVSTSDVSLIVKL
jgi:hypothetical protein